MCEFHTQIKCVNFIPTNTPKANSASLLRLHSTSNASSSFLSPLEGKEGGFWGSGIIHEVVEYEEEEEVLKSVPVCPDSPSLACQEEEGSHRYMPRKEGAEKIPFCAIPFIFFCSRLSRGSRKCERAHANYANIFPRKNNICFFPDETHVLLMDCCCLSVIPCSIFEASRGKKAAKDSIALVNKRRILCIVMWVLFLSLLRM